MANNEKGLNAINNLENVFKEERSLDEAVTENHNVIHVSVKHKDRDAIVRAFNDDSETLQSINDKFHLTDRSLKGIVKQYAECLGLFDTVKRAYNWVKTLK